MGPPAAAQISKELKSEDAARDVFTTIIERQPKASPAATDRENDAFPSTSSWLLKKPMTTPAWTAVPNMKMIPQSQKLRPMPRNSLSRHLRDARDRDATNVPAPGGPTLSTMGLGDAGPRRRNCPNQPTRRDRRPKTSKVTSRATRPPSPEARAQPFAFSRKTARRDALARLTASLR